jgi:gliding motility-associated-like protein
MNVFRSSILVSALIMGVMVGQVGSAFAQLTVASGLNATALAQLLAGPGITISNATMTGAPDAAGSFNGSASNIGMASGILLCTGPVTLAPGPNNSGSAGTDNGQPGNAQLNGLAQAQTFNAFVLEFDFIPLSNTIEFQYVFGSEEYPEWVNSGFNDAFAFFISGPGIAGQQNIAVVPGTAIPVTINNINGGSFPQYYVNNAGGATIQYDGFTTVLTATSIVQACQTYHLQLMIADGGDGVWDSGVFLEEGSLTSNVIEITTTTATADSTAYENCSVATVTFSLSDVVSSDYEVFYNLTGTATNGTDYPLLPGSITIPAGTQSASFVIDPFFDGVMEGVETILIDLQTSVCGSDTILIYVNDVSPVTVEAFGDTAFCGGTAMLWASSQGGAGGYTYAWSNGMATDTIYVSPTTTTTYTVTSNDFCSSTVPVPSASATVTIDPTPLADAGPDIPYCAGDAVTLTGAGGTVYEWFDITNNAVVGVASPTTILPIGDVDLRMITWIGSCSDTDFVSLTELPASPADAVGDTSICAGESTPLDVVGAVNSTFSWWPIAGLSNPLVQNPIATPVATTVYTVTVTSISGCVKTDSVLINIDPIPVVDFSVPDVCLNEFSLFQNLSSISAGSIQSFAWTFGDGNAAANLNPTNLYTGATSYNVQLVATSAQGCADSIAQTTTVHPLPVANFSFANDCQDKQIPFFDLSSVPTGQISVWNWDFGNSNTASVQNPAPQNYNWDGFFQVTLNVETQFGCTDDSTQTIEIFPVPLAALSFDSVCLGFANQFNDLSSANGNYPIDTWNWAFSDGQTSAAQHPSVQFSQYGFYQATVTVTTTAGCIDDVTAGNAVVHPLPVSAFSNVIKNCLNDTTWFQDLSSCPNQLGDAINWWNWNLGDGASSSNQNDSHVYGNFGFFPVSLITQTNKGCRDTLTQQVEIFPLPTVSFSSDLTQGCQPLRVLFEDMTTIPAPYSIASWVWDIGDGNGPITTQHPVNIYNNDSMPVMSIAEYTVSLQATSLNGCVSQDTVVNYITEYPKPDALFSADPWVTDVLSPVIRFSDLSSENVTDWLWEFGDGETATDQHPSHSFPDVGTYDVVLYSLTQYGCADTISAPVKIEPIFTFYVPSAFTPNEDGVNEEFFGQGEGIKSYSMYVYDRWGELIFISNDEAHRWDGTFKGKQVQKGVYIYYFYLLDWRNDDHEYRGHVNLIR